jgi:hypothetical protein
VSKAARKAVKMEVQKAYSTVGLKEHLKVVCLVDTMAAKWVEK